MMTVSSGINILPLKDLYRGKPVAFVRRMFRGVLNIQRRARVQWKGRMVTDRFVIPKSGDGDLAFFYRRAHAQH